MILHYQQQVLEESGNQNCPSKIEVYDCAINTVLWNVKDLMDTLMEQIKTELIWDWMILSIETLSIILKHSLEFLECSLSGVRIEVCRFSIESSHTNVNFFIVIFFEKVSPYFIEKNMFEFWCDAKNWIFWALSVNFAFDSAQRRVFFQSCTNSRELSIGNLMEDFRLLVTEKKQFEGQDFTLSIASFGGIGKSESQIKDRNLWLCNQVCLLKCKGSMDALMEQIKTELIWDKLNLRIETLSYLYALLGSFSG